MKYKGDRRDRRWIENKARNLRRGEWIGVDLDGTLAEYDGWQGASHIGDPIEGTVKLVRGWLEMGLDVRILTARVTHPAAEKERIRDYVEAWCLQHLGKRLPVTGVKGWQCAFFLDDRAIQVVPDTGELVWDLVDGLEQLPGATS